MHSLVLFQISQEEILWTLYHHAVVSVCAARISEPDLRPTLQSRARSPTQYIRGTAAELRQPAGHDVPPPPRTWAEQLPWPADGSPPASEGPQAASAPPPEFLTNNDDDEFEWTSDRLDLLDRAVNRDHADRLHQLQLDMQIMQNHLYTFIGKDIGGDKKE